MKKHMIIVIFLFTSLLVFGENTDDRRFRDRADYFMKFRGTVVLSFAYFPGIHDGIAGANHLSFPNNSLLDYRNTGDSDNDHHTSDNDGRIIGQKGGEPKLQLNLTYDFIAPFLNFDHPLFKGNNIKLSFYGQATPVSIGGGGGITFTPVAFLNFYAGFTIGSAWNIPAFKPGLGRNLDGELLKESFYGPIMNIFFSSTFQFDVAAVLPKKYKRWTHIVMRLTPTINYRALLNVSENTSFTWLTDRGENLNGWNLKGSFLLGYQIPVIEDDFGNDRQFIKVTHKNFKITAAIYLLIEELRLSHFYDSQMKNKGWGSDFTYIDFGPLIKFDLPYNFFFTAIVFWANDKEFSSETVGNLYYQDREYVDWYVYLRRIIIQFGYNF